MKFRFLFAALMAAATWVGPASAAPIAAVGTTDVTVAGGVLDLLSDNGITASPIAPAMQSGATFMFPIVGGDTSTLVIEHSGGVLFDDGTAMLSATNFLIDGGGGTVSANVNGGAGFVPLFTLASVDLSGPITADLLITPELSEAFVGTFLSGIVEPDALTGAEFGSASTSPAAVPLPASALLLVSGLAGLAAFRRRKSAA